MTTKNQFNSIQFNPVSATKMEFPVWDSTNLVDDRMARLRRIRILLCFLLDVLGWGAFHARDFVVSIMSTFPNPASHY
jgi:hypothetical protein